MQVEHDNSSFNSPPDVGQLMRNLFADDWMPKTGLGGLFCGGAVIAILFSFVCLPLFAALWALTIGYCLRCIRLKLDDPEAKLPDWNEWGDLFMSGITWLALQTGTWIISAAINFSVLVFCITYGFTEKSEIASLCWAIGGMLFVFVNSAVVTLYSSYLMVNFAIEENVAGGLALRKVTTAIILAPKRLIAGFLLALGIQWLMTVIPSSTIIGVIFAPQMYFASQLISALILAQHWKEPEEAR